MIYSNHHAKCLYTKFSVYELDFPITCMQPRIDAIWYSFILPDVTRLEIIISYFIFIRKLCKNSCIWSISDILMHAYVYRRFELDSKLSFDILSLFANSAKITEKFLHMINIGHTDACIHIPYTSSCRPHIYMDTQKGYSIVWLNCQIDDKRLKDSN